MATLSVTVGRVMRTGKGADDLAIFDGSTTQSLTSLTTSGTFAFVQLAGADYVAEADSIATIASAGGASAVSVSSQGEADRIFTLASGGSITVGLRAGQKIKARNG